MMLAAGTPESSLPPFLWAWLLVPGILAIAWTFRHLSRLSAHEGDDQ